MQSQCRIRSRESGMWGVGVGRWRLAESKRTEEKSEHSWEGRRHQVRRLAVHLCAFMLCTHTASKAGMHAAEREKKNNGKTVEFNTGTP